MKLTKYNETVRNYQINLLPEYLEEMGRGAIFQQIIDDHNALEIYLNRDRHPELYYRALYRIGEDRHEMESYLNGDYRRLGYRGQSLHNIVLEELREKGLAP